MIPEGRELPFERLDWERLGTRSCPRRCSSHRENASTQATTSSTDATSKDACDEEVWSPALVQIARPYRVLDLRDDNAAGRGLQLYWIKRMSKGITQLGADPTVFDRPSMKKITQLLQNTTALGQASKQENETAW